MFLINVLTAHNKTNNKRFLSFSSNQKKTVKKTRSTKLFRTISNLNSKEKIKSETYCDNIFWKNSQGNTRTVTILKSTLYYKVCNANSMQSIELFVHRREERVYIS